MRLLNCTTLEFCEFFDSDIPKYVILSHRWGSDEASFQDFEKELHHSRQGFAKIRKCCDVAKEYKYKWAWVDTCCIDKKSSAELTEAINSMYKWYQKAEICCVYLVDVSWEIGSIDGYQASMEGFRQSSWFTRGWTLQELLAPRIVWFFDHDWRYIGSKDDLAHEISEITGIDTEYLHPHAAPFERPLPCTKSLNCRAHRPYSKYQLTGRWEPSVATRMSWASKRQTSRIEDTAYCLLGLFDVNMPLLYGEGTKAFIRLQHEIIKNTSDESIFAWTDESENPMLRGVLARSPTNFANSRYVHDSAASQGYRIRGPCAITSQGLEFPVTWRTWTLKTSNLPVLRVMLECGTCGPQGFKNIILSFICWQRTNWTRVFSNQIDVKGDGEWYNAKPLKRVPNPFAAIEISYARTLEDLTYGLRRIMIETDWIDGDGDGYRRLAYAQSPISRRFGLLEEWSPST